MSENSKPCGICGKPLENTKHGRKMCRECSTTPCEVCGKLIKQNSLQKRRVACGRACTYERYKSLPNETVGASCVACGTVFQVWKSRLAKAKYCSKPCKEKCFRKVLSESLKAVRANPEYRKRQSEITRAGWAKEEIRRSHVEAVSTSDYRQQRSRIAQDIWTKPGYRDKVLTGEKRRRANAILKKRVAPPPIKWTMYGETKMRSSWEASFAEFCDALGVRWVYEPCFFDLSDGSRYTPDFKVLLHGFPVYVELHRIGEDAKPGDEKKLKKLALAEQEMPQADDGAPLMIVGQAFVLAMRKFLKAHAADEALSG
jgi:hypothetical protein